MTEKGVVSNWREPKSWSKSYRILHLCIVSTGLFLVSWSASVYLSVAPAVAEEFGVNTTESRLPFVFYILAWGAGPLLIGPFADYYGRSPMYFYTILLWSIFHIGAATSNNLAALIITRFFAAFFGSSHFVMGGAVAVDLFEGLDVARFFSLNISTIWFGPVLGPLLGGFIAQYCMPLVSRYGGWRWTMWASAIAGLVLAIVEAFLPETHTQLLAKSSPRTRFLFFGGRSIGDPSLQQLSPLRRIVIVGSQAAKMIVTEPIILFLSIWQSTVFGIVYMFFSAFPVVFEDIYHFDEAQVGLSFLGLLVGLAAYSIFDYTYLTAWWGRRVASKGPSPEHRTIPAMISGVCIVVSLFLFAALARPSVHWIGPIIASALYGFGALGVVLSTFGYLLDTYKPCIPAAAAAISVVRSAITAFCPLFGDVFFRNVGVQNASIILACISLLELGIPLIALVYGRKIRSKSQQAAKD
ncbi:hypothetical protein CBS101457_002985 [Exobasidium rhododendri]|nr:hypothetical protein CBS101457_002985 [Exobasidium rhododendri]